MIIIVYSLQEHAIVPFGFKPRAGKVLACQCVVQLASGPGVSKVIFEIENQGIARILNDNE